MTAARPPGWYDEPSGDRAALRWWDGRSWTSVTRQRAPFEELPPPPAEVSSPWGSDGDLLDSGAPRPGASALGTRRRLILAVLAVGVVGLLLTVGIPGQQFSGRLADPGPPSTGPATPFEPTTPFEPATPSEPAPTTARPVTGRVTDRVARLSYAVLPGDWREWDRESFRGLLSTLGYYRVTQDSAPSGQTYWANVTSGRVSPATASRADLPSTASRLVDTLARDYYPKHTREQVARRALTVDGAPAHLVRYRAIFDRQAAEGYVAKSEEVAVLVVDTGEGLPSALYVSLPDTVRSLWPSVDDLIASVRVVR